MNINDLRPASAFAQQYGAKCIVYGPPGSAKTPLINTAPRPLLLSTESGLLSMRDSKVPTYQAQDIDAIEGFFDWFFSSKEADAFDTLAIDSGSHIADIYLQQILTGKSKAGNKMHGEAAYGKMGEECMKHFRKLYFHPRKHIYMICKEGDFGGVKRPYFPGKMLNTLVPHDYDFILHLAKHNVPGMGQVLSFQCNGTIDVLARARTGNLNDYEEPNFGNLVAKAMS